MALKRISYQDFKKGSFCTVRMREREWNDENAQRAHTEGKRDRYLQKLITERRGKASPRFVCIIVVMFTDLMERKPMLY
jgi:hypothetical protein